MSSGPQRAAFGIDGIGGRSPLIGRERDVDLIFARFDEPGARLVTLTGPGGVGKTRVALAVAAEARERFPGGVRFAALATIDDPARVPAAVAATFGLGEVGVGEEIESIAAVVGSDRSLLVLDNMEQISEAGPFLTRLLAAIPALTLLVTSRMALRLTGEIEIPVAPLQTTADVAERTGDPAEISPAIALFISRARLVRPDLELTPANLAAIAEICRRLDGLPLAIELAAARSKVLSPTSLLSRLSHTLPVLTGGPRDAPERLRSLRDAIGWSYDLLTPEDQRIFRGAGIFRGGFTVDSLTSVLELDADGLDVIGALVDRSLVIVGGQDDDEPRFGMLETIREFAESELQRTGEREDLLARLADWVFTFTRSSYQEFFTPGETAAMTRLEGESANIALALEWLIANDPTRAGLVIRHVWYFWGVRGKYREGLNWIERLNAHGGFGEMTQADLNLASGVLLWATGHVEQATPNLVSAKASFLEHDTEGRAGLAGILLGSLYRDQGDFEAAEAEYLTSLDFLEQHNKEAWSAFGYSFIGAMERSRGNFDRSIAYLEKGLAIARRLGFTGALSPLIDNLGDISRILGEYERSLEYYQQTMDLWIEQRDPQGAADGLVGIGEVLTQLGDDEGAVYAIAGAVTTYHHFGIPRIRYGPAYREELVDQLRERLGKDQFETIWRKAEQTGWREVAETAARYRPQVKPKKNAGGKPADPLAAFGLTARELEILDLLVEGKSNAEIGETLSISGRTAGTHVANVFSKLGCTNRAAAVSIALRARAGKPINSDG